VYVYSYFTGRGALLPARQTFYATVHGGWAGSWLPHAP
jgi:hypothetical protein